jgi:hypothetical protein
MTAREIRKAILEGKPGHLMTTTELRELILLRNDENYHLDVISSGREEVIDKGIEYAK